MRVGLGSEQLAPWSITQAHAAAAYYTSSVADEAGKVLVLTCDGSGDRLSRHGEHRRSGKSRRGWRRYSEHDSIGRLYALVTRYLGMAPLEHEYKVMGLAPYVGGSAAGGGGRRGSKRLFEFTARSLGWRRRTGCRRCTRPTSSWARLLAGQRFDYVAAGAQRFIERLLTTGCGLRSAKPESAGSPARAACS